MATWRPFAGHLSNTACGHSRIMLEDRESVSASKWREEQAELDRYSRIGYMRQATRPCLIDLGQVSQARRLALLQTSSACGRNDGSRARVFPFVPPVFYEYRSARDAHHPCKTVGCKNLQVAFEQPAAVTAAHKIGAEALWPRSPLPKDSTSSVACFSCGPCIHTLHLFGRDASVLMVLKRVCI